MRLRMPQDQSCPTGGRVNITVCLGRQHDASNHRNPDSAPDVELSAGSAPLAAHENPQGDTRCGEHGGWRWPVTITITSYRKRLCDADGISGKAAIDGIVAAGLLPDDSPEYVSEVRYRQIKSSVEKTVITIEDQS